MDVRMFFLQPSNATEDREESTSDFVYVDVVTFQLVQLKATCVVWVPGLKDYWQIVSKKT